MSGNGAEPGVNLAALTAPFPRDVIKQRQIGGGRMADYIPGEVVIRRLNEATGNDWSLTIKNIDERPFTGGTLVMAMVALTIPGLGTREHIGVQSVADRGGEDLIKGAVTDAIKKAATLFGVGLHLYDDEMPNAAPRAASGPQEATSNGDAGEPTITDQQMRRLWKVANDKLGNQANSVVHALLQRIGLDSVKKLTMARAAKVIGYLERTEAAEIVEQAGLAPEGDARAASGQPAPISEGEAALIAFRERAEASTDWEADRLYAEAGDSQAHWLELVAVAPAVPVLNRVEAHIKRRELLTPEVSTAIADRRRALRARADALSR